MNAKIGALIALVGLTTGVQASFELMLVSDNNSGSGTGSIKRFDPTNGVYLGEFGRGRLQNITSMALSQPRGKVYVADSSGQFASISEFDYSTGERTRIFSSTTYFSIEGMAISGNTLYGIDFTGSTNRILTMDLTTGNFNTYSNANLGIVNNMTISGGTGYLSVSTGVWSFNLASPNTFNLVSSTNSTALSPVSVASGTSGLCYANNSNFLVFPSLSESYLGVSQFVGLAQGHQDIYGLTSRISGGYDVLRIQNYYPYLAYGYMGIQGSLNAPKDVVVVTAPEPTSMVALAAGAIALIRRRKSSK